MQIHIYSHTLQYSEEIGYEVAPVGWAWYGVLDELNYPLHYLHMSDWNHPSLRGSYLMACVVYSSLFQESTTGNPYNAGLPEDEVNFFQEVATDTVLNNLELWNIPPTVGLTGNNSKPGEFRLYQNQPNPFDQITRIPYSISKKQNISITVLDSKGAAITTLIDQIQGPGQYKVEFKASGLSSGLYFYRIMAGGESSTRAMILK